MSKTLAHDGFKKYLRPCALGESSLNIGRVKLRIKNDFPNSWSYLPFQCWAYFRPNHKDEKSFENHLNLVILVFIG